MTHGGVSKHARTYNGITMSTTAEENWLGLDGVLHVRGFILLSIFGENRDWTRVK